MKKILFLPFFCLIFCASQGQSNDYKEIVTAIENSQLRQAADKIESYITQGQEVKEPLLFYYKGYTFKEIYKTNPKSDSADFYRITSLNALNKCLELDTDSSYRGNALDVYDFVNSTLYDEGVRYFEKQNYRQALSKFNIILQNTSREALRVWNFYPEVLFLTGFSHNKLANKAEAESYFLQAIDYHVERPLAYSQLSELYLQDGRADKSLEIVQQGQELFPEDMSLKIAEVNALIALDDYKQAEKRIENLLQNDPNNMELLLVAASVYEKRGIENKSLTDEYYQKRKNLYKKALEIDQDNLTANYNMGILLYNRAVDMVNAETETYSIDIQKLDQLVKQVTDLFKKSLPYLERAYQIDPNRKRTLKALEGIYFYLDQKEKANFYKYKLDSIKG